ncbi:MAG: hypothetical protein ACXVPQ_00585 [Bacteroidia bacterium]
MKTESELNEDILKITMTIHQKFPELSKYIKEMPMKLLETTDPESNLINLKNYYDSLCNLLKNYGDSHRAAAK